MNSRLRRKARRAYSRAVKNITKPMVEFYTRDRGQTPLMEFLQENKRDLTSPEAKTRYRKVARFGHVENMDTPIDQ